MTLGSLIIYKMGTLLKHVASLVSNGMGSFYPEHQKSMQLNPVSSICPWCPLTLTLPELLQFFAPFYIQVSDVAGQASKPLSPHSLPILPPRVPCKEISSCLLLNSRDVLVIFEQRGRGRVIFLAGSNCQEKGWKTLRVNSHCPSSQT